jgi:hypothetical protein
MRLFAAAAIVALAFAAASPAMAADVALRPMTVDAKLQDKFADDYGEREVAVLRKMVESALSRELTQAGATIADSGPVAVETTLVDVKPSRPTFQQAIDKPGLDTIRSISIGGAELHARLVGADGTTLRDVTYEWYESDLAFSTALTTWGDAERAIRRFADKVGDAYRESAAN